MYSGPLWSAETRSVSLLSVELRRSTAPCTTRTPQPGAGYELVPGLGRSPKHERNALLDRCEPRSSFAKDRDTLLLGPSSGKLGIPCVRTQAVKRNRARGDKRMATSDVDAESRSIKPLHASVVVRPTGEPIFAARSAADAYIPRELGLGNAGSP